MISFPRFQRSILISLIGLMWLCAGTLAGTGEFDGDTNQWCGTSKENDRRIQAVYHTQRARARQARQKDRGQHYVFQESTPIRMVDGVVLMEDDGYLTSNDHPIPIPEHTTIRLVPNAFHSYNVFSAPYAYETNVGMKILDYGQPAVEVPLGFNFPMGGDSFSTVWLSSYGGISLGASQQNAQTYLAEVIWRNRLPRLCPLSSRLTKRAYFRTEVNRAFFTWRWYGSEGSIDFQLVIDASGEATFCYRKLYRV